MVARSAAAGTRGEDLETDGPGEVGLDRKSQGEGCCDVDAGAADAAVLGVLVEADAVRAGMEAHS